MSPFKRGELSFQVSDAKDNEQGNIEDLVLENNAKRGRGRSRKSLSLGTSNHNYNDDYEKEIIHREIECQRRQEMSNLYTSLRSVLPDEYVHGKRTISEHVGEAINYIKELEKNVKDLGEKRDQLRKPEESTSSRHEPSGSTNSLPVRSVVMIRQFVGGLQIEISVSYEDEEFSLSTALQVVFEEGLTVISCSSTNVSDCLVHNLICKVSDISCIDVNRLQQRLIDLVC